jgi:nickel/cobalt transporter (NicO) family protein
MIFLQSIGLAAAIVAIGHAILPDHWAPLAVIARTRRWSVLRTARVSLLAAVGHLITSLLLGLVLAIIGTQFRSVIEVEQGHIIGALLAFTGLGLLLWTITRHGNKHDHDHDYDHEHTTQEMASKHEHEHHSQSTLGWMSIVVPFGTAASPDLTFLPIALAASAIGMGEVVGVLAIYAILTLATFVGLTLLVTVGGYQFRWDWIEEYGDQITAIVLLVIGGLIFFGLI